MDRAIALMELPQSRNSNRIPAILSLLMAIGVSCLIILNLLNIFPAILLVGVLLINSYTRYYLFRTE